MNDLSRSCKLHLDFNEFFGILPYELRIFARQRFLIDLTPGFASLVEKFGGKKTLGKNRRTKRF